MLGSSKEKDKKINVLLRESRGNLRIWSCNKLVWFFLDRCENEVRLFVLNWYRTKLEPIPFLEDIPALLTSEGHRKVLNACKKSGN